MRLLRNGRLLVCGCVEKGKEYIDALTSPKATFGILSLGERRWGATPLRISE
jgi:hypothetical protein